MNSLARSEGNGVHTREDGGRIAEGWGRECYGDLLQCIRLDIRDEGGF